MELKGGSGGRCYGFFHGDPQNGLALEVRFFLEPNQKDLVKKLVLDAEQDMALFEYNIRSIREDLVGRALRAGNILLPWALVGDRKDPVIQLSDPSPSHSSTALMWTVRDSFTVYIHV